MKRHIFKTIVVGCTVFCGALLSAQGGAPSVLVSNVTEIAETGIRKYVGRLEAIKDAAIPARVSGELMKCNFQEGDTVQAGDILFELDDAIYQAAKESATAQVAQANAQIAQANAQIQQAVAQIKQAEAQKAQAKAQKKQANATKKYADDEFKRAEKLKNVEAQKSHDAAKRDQAHAEAQLAAADAQIAAADAAKATAEGNKKAAEASREAAKASLAAAKAALKNAEINLSYTKIKAPFTGKVGKATFSVGNYVTPNSGSLVQLTQINPIYVRFAISEPDYLKFVTEAYTLENDKNTKKNATELLSQYIGVHITLSNNKPYDKPAKISIVDNKIQSSTGTLMIWATIDNSTFNLTPGAVVKVQVTKKQAIKKPAVPISAIQISQQGQYVWVLNPATNEVVPMPVKPGEIVGAYQIVSGLSVGQKIVIDGMHKIIPIPGQASKVVPTDKSAPAAK